MFTDNRKEEMEITETPIKAVEKEIYTDVDTSLSMEEEIQSNDDLVSASEIFYSNQSTYNMEGESLW